MSWLNNTVGDSTVSPLIAEISRLQRELDRANESIDDKLDKLEDAGLGVVGLTKKLEDARSRIVALEDEIARLSRREDRRIRRLERARCQKCHTKVDLRGMTHPSEGDERYVLWLYSTSVLRFHLMLHQFVGNPERESSNRTSYSSHQDQRSAASQFTVCQFPSRSDAERVEEGEATTPRGEGGA
jgi:hypothetical protein